MPIFVSRTNNVDKYKVRNMPVRGNEFDIRTPTSSIVNNDKPYNRVSRNKAKSEASAEDMPMVGNERES